MGLCFAAMTGQSAVAAGDANASTQWIPADAVLAVELFQPKALLAPFGDGKSAAAFAALPGVGKRKARPGYEKFMGVVKYLETQLGADWPTALTKMTGGGAAFALRPQQQVVFIADAEDVQMLTQLQDFLWKAASGNKSGTASSQQVDGVTAWSLGPKEAHTIIGKRLVLSSGFDGLQTALAFRSKPGGSSLAATPAYQAAKRAVGPDAAGMIFINMAVLKQAPGLAKALEPKNGNPLVALLFAGITESAGAANWLALGLHVNEKEDSLALQVVTDGAKPDPKGAAAFALPAKREEGALPNLAVPRQIAGLSLYRDLRRFYGAKDQLFPERTSGLIFFENMMGIFFCGRDMTDDVMAQARPEIRLVVANQQYDPAVGTPSPQIPAFALVLQMRNPAQFREVMEEAWQKAVGLASFTRGQKADPGFVIDRPVHWTTKYSVAKFSSTGVKDRSKLDVRFNFSPSLAMPGNYLILSSTEQLTCDLIDAVGREAKQPPAPLAQTHSLLEAKGDRVAAALLANRDNMVRQNMLKSGASGEANAAGIDALITFTEFVERLRLSFTAESGLNQARLELKFKWPSPLGQNVAETR
ncbi:MAG: hypothetical protein A2107_15460 [Verrucomicrobia bacterium GWF2_62_7]|nr:MAG: hypothetical protein A2107_15460 [Verrucomicrobia bacterium GWF2_62_7]